MSVQFSIEVFPYDKRFVGIVSRTDRYSSVGYLDGDTVHTINSLDEDLPTFKSEAHVIEHFERWCKAQYNKPEKKKVVGHKFIYEGGRVILSGSVIL